MNNSTRTIMVKPRYSLNSLTKRVVRPPSVSSDMSSIKKADGTKYLSFQSNFQIVRMENATVASVICGMQKRLQRLKKRDVLNRKDEEESRYLEMEEITLQILHPN